MKRLSDSYLYQTADFNKTIFSYLMSSERVDKSVAEFNDVVYAIKKQAPPILSKVLLSNKVVLMIDKKGISRPFKVINVINVKDDNKDRKVFIDCTKVISNENNTYSCKKIGILISYLTTAMTYILYYNKDKTITTNALLTKTGAEAFTDLMIYVLGYLKVPVSFADNKERMSFVIAEYYQTCVLGVPNGESVYNMAKLVSGIKEKKTCDYLHTLFSFLFDNDCDINKFIIKFAEIFMDQKENDTNSPKNRIRLTIDAFVQRWMYAFGPSTIFALECFVPFSQMLTDCYTGAFLNQQNTIEKIARGKIITSFSNELLRVGGENS